MLSKPFFDSVRLAHISLALIGLMWVLPFLYPEHPFPILSFYGEWAAALLGLCAMCLLVEKRFWPQFKIPRIALLPAALLLLVLIQFALGRGVYFDQSLLIALYFLWAMLLIILGSHLRDELGLPTLAATLALFLLVGAELSALIGLLQHYPGHASINALVMPSKGAAVFGNLAQANHLANYLTLGLISLGLLHSQRKLRMWQWLLLAAPLLFVLALTGSRSPWLYLSFIAGMSFLWHRRDKSFLPTLQYSLLLLLGFGLMNLVVQLPWLVGPHGNQTATQKLIEAATNGDIRLSIWREAWLIFTQHPFLGAGFGQFRWQHFQLGPVLRDASLSNLNMYVEHAHNLVLQLAAETGLAGLLVLFGTVALWLVQAYRAPRSVAHWWGYAVLAVLSIHSMLEYPLWYAGFLGVAAIMLGVLDESACRFKLRWNLGGGRWLVLAMLLSGVLFLSLMLADYRKLVRLQGAMQRAEKMEEGSSRQAIYRRIHDELVTMHGRVILLDPYVENMLGDSGWDHVADKRALNERVMRFAPNSLAVHREVMLLARDGRQEEARVMMERAIWTYPAQFPVMREKLEKLARMDRNPERFPALLEFALQKYAEWQRETHYKDTQ